MWCAPGRVLANARIYRPGSYVLCPHGAVHPPLFRACELLSIERLAKSLPRRLCNIPLTRQTLAQGTDPLGKFLRLLHCNRYIVITWCLSSGKVYGSFQSVPRSLCGFRASRNRDPEISTAAGSNWIDMLSSVFRRENLKRSYYCRGVEKHTAFSSAVAVGNLSDGNGYMYWYVSWNRIVHRYYKEPPLITRF
jgi:hypothetical protein